jgi:hypothetical protein
MKGPFNLKPAQPLLYEPPRAGDIWVQRWRVVRRRILIKHVDDYAERYVHATTERTGISIRKFTEQDYRTGRFGLSPTGQRSEPLILAPPRFVDPETRPPEPRKVKLPRLSPGELTKMRDRAHLLKGKGVSVPHIADALSVSLDVAKRLLELGRSAA